MLIFHLIYFIFRIEFIKLEKQANEQKTCQQSTKLIYRVIVISLSYIAIIDIFYRLVTIELFELFTRMMA